MQKAAVVHSLDRYPVCHAALRRLKPGLRARDGGISKVGSRHDVNGPSGQVHTAAVQKLPHSLSLPIIIHAKNLISITQNITSTMASLSCKPALCFAIMQLMDLPHNAARRNCSVFCNFHIKTTINC
jgi:hypothetical protein